MKANTFKIYARMGDAYFHRKGSNIETFENIIFLMQYDAITNTEFSFIKEKIYIDGEKIKVHFLSDLLRVAPFTFFLPKASNMILIDKYSKTFKTYVKLDDLEIKEKVLEVISKGKLDERYFIYGNYDNQLQRKMARFYMHRVIQAPLFICLSLLLVPLTVGSTYSIGMCLYLVCSGKYPLINQPFTFIFYLCIADLVFCLLSYIWLKKWTKPTEFEIQNGYVEE